MIRVPISASRPPVLQQGGDRVGDYATGRCVAKVSQANPGLISRDLMADPWRELRELRTVETHRYLARAAEYFMEAALPVGESSQTPEDFVAVQSATTGLPWALCRQNMRKIASAMRNMTAILDGLTGGLDPDTLDAGHGQHGRAHGKFRPPCTAIRRRAARPILPGVPPFGSRRLP